jgi:3-oxoacyl-[acyl-carrier protein] reductase
MLLAGKNAVVYGGAGSVGGAVARAFAREGARVFLAGRTVAALERVASEIIGAGGAAEPAPVDALDREVVEEHLEAIVGRAGTIDVSFNAVDSRSVQGTPLIDLSIEQFDQPIATYTRAQFLTSSAAARHMLRQRSGVIMMITATPARLAIPLVGGFGAACAAVEALARQLACELGPHGVRVVCLRSAGSPDAAGVQEAFEVQDQARGADSDAFATALTGTTLLGRLPTLAEVAETAVFLASDRASAITATVANITCGQIAD